MKRQLLPDGRQRFTLEKVARVFVGAARRLAVGALFGRALGRRQVGLFRAIQFGGGEAERRDALQLAHQRVEAPDDAVVRHQGLQRRFVARLRRRKQPAPGCGAQERRPVALGDLVETVAQHLREQLIFQNLAIAADRSLIARRPQIADAHRGVGGFLVGQDDVAGAGMLGHVENRPRPLGHRIGERREVPGNHRRDGVPVDVADDHHRHQIRPVPVAIEAHQLVTLRALNHRRIADRRSVRVPRALQLRAPQLVGGPFVGAEIAPPLGEHDRTLALDRGGVEEGAAGPVFEDGQRRVEYLRTIGRHAQRVLRVVEAGHRVRVRAEAQADRRQEVVDALSGKMARPLELHVLDEVGEAALIVVFEHRSGLDDQPQFGLARGPGIGPDIEAQPVGQAADQDLGIDGHVRLERVGSHRCGGRVAAARDLGGWRRGNRGNEQTDEETGGGAPGRAEGVGHVWMQRRLAASSIVA
jgi:hypothetical protein